MALYGTVPPIQVPEMTIDIYIYIYLYVPMISPLSISIHHIISYPYIISHPVIVNMLLLKNIDCIPVPSNIARTGDMMAPQKW